MSSTRDEFAVLLAGPSPTSLDLARELLTSAGIPSIVHGLDRGLVGFGAAYAWISAPDLLVPRSALERAQALLREAWDEGSLTDEVAMSAREPEEKASRSRLSAFVWILLAASFALPFLFGLVGLLRFFGPRS